MLTSVQPKEKELLMRELKIYTKIGDKGYTNLGTGAKVAKSSQRVGAYGTIDELNSWIALIKDSVNEKWSPSPDSDAWQKKLSDSLAYLQNILFIVGSELACPVPIATHKESVKFAFQVIGEEHLQFLEHDIDRMTSFLKPLKNFILPGGHPLISKIHISRTVCRRAERELVGLAETEPEYFRIFLITFTNRLSDWLFTLARFMAFKLGVEEIKWQGKI